MVTGIPETREFQGWLGVVLAQRHTEVVSAVIQILKIKLEGNFRSFRHAQRADSLIRNPGDVVAHAAQASRKRRYSFPRWTPWELEKRKVAAVYERYL